jgi:hypothetical protein
MKKRQSLKKQFKARKKREPRTSIISFRIRETEAQLLAVDLERRPVIGIKSLKQFARKLTIDYARDRLVYVREVERRLDPEARNGVKKIEAPNCQLSDPRFIKSLRNFLRDEESWHRLRLFMLVTGWPPKFVKVYRATKNKKKRLRIARKVLTSMLRN